MFPKKLSFCCGLTIVYWSWYPGSGARVDSLPAYILLLTEHILRSSCIVLGGPKMGL